MSDSAAKLTPAAQDTKPLEALERLGPGATQSLDDFRADLALIRAALERR